MEHAQAFETVQDGRIYIEKLNGPFLFGDKASPAEYTASLELAISRGWLTLHESGTFVKLTQSGGEHVRLEGGGLSRRAVISNRELGLKKK